MGGSKNIELVAVRRCSTANGGQATPGQRFVTHPVRARALVAAGLAEYPPKQKPEAARWVDDPAALAIAEADLKPSKKKKG